MARLSGKTALVTGAGSGIGRAVALAFAREGANVIVSDLDEKGGLDTVEQIKKLKGNAGFVKADVASPEDNRHIVDEAIRMFGTLHIACNNAGIGGPIAPTAEYPLEGWKKVIDINLSGVFFGMRYQIPAMLKSGGGSIINIASILGAVGTANSPAYVAAKHGVVGLTKSTALEYATQNIRVNAVGPGYILTPLLTKNLTDDVLEVVKGLHPLKRLGNVEEVAALIVFLSSDEASFITGSYYPVDGGYLAQ